MKNSVIVPEAVYKKMKRYNILKTIMNKSQLIKNIKRKI